MQTPTEQTTAIATGMMDDLYRNARVLARKANDVEDPTDEQVEKAFYVLATELLKREDTREMMAKAMVIAASARGTTPDRLDLDRLTPYELRRIVETA